MWTNDNRTTYERKSCRYPSDLTDEEWGIVAPLMPPPRKARRHSVPETREVLNAILYVLTTGCQWRQLPKDLPSKSMVHDYLVCWDRDGVLALVHGALYGKARELAGRNATASLGIVDSQSVKGAEKGGASIDPVGYDAGKKVKGKKRHICVDTQGLLINFAITPAE